MSIWIDNLWLSLTFGGITFLVLLIPGIIWLYRHDGHLRFSRFLGWAMICVYMTALVVYTLLPLPEDGKEWCRLHKISYNLQPLTFVDDIRVETAGMSTQAMLTSPVFLQVFFNVLLFIPLGLILKRFFGRGIVVSTILGAAASVLIELTQFTGIFGIYPCSFRVADVDDVILNTIGALLGAVLAPAVMWWMPTTRALTAKRREPRPVTTMRRWTGMVLDIVLYGVISVAAELCMTAGQWVITGSYPDRATPQLIDAVPAVVGLLVVFVIPALTGSGASIGQTIVWLSPKWVGEDGRTLTDGTLIRRVARSLIIPGTWVVGVWVMWVLKRQTMELSPIIAMIAAVVMFGEVGLAFLMVPFTKTHRSLSGLLTGAVFVDSRQGGERPTPQD